MERKRKFHFNWLIFEYVQVVFSMETMGDFFDTSIKGSVSVYWFCTFFDLIKQSILLLISLSYDIQQLKHVL